MGRESRGFAILTNTRLLQHLAIREGVAHDIAKLDVVVVNGVVGYGAQLAVVDLTVGEDTLVGTYIHNATYEVVALHVVGYHLALQGEG